jgi:hypothetical protein
MIVIDGSRTDIPGLVTRCWDDDPALRATAHGGGPRGAPWVRSVVLHTTRGVPGGRDARPQVLHAGAGAPGGAAANAHYWHGLKADAYAGAHLVVDADGSVLCTADLVREQTWHATSVNGVSVGVELVQGADAGLYTVQLDAAVRLCDFLAARLGIQRQYHAPYRGSAHPVPRLAAGGADCVGFFGHRDQTSNRGPGDPATPCSPRSRGRATRPSTSPRGRPEDVERPSAFARRGRRRRPGSGDRGRAETCRIPRRIVGVGPDRLAHPRTDLAQAEFTGGFTKRRAARTPCPSVAPVAPTQRNHDNAHQRFR